LTRETGEDSDSLSRGRSKERRREPQNHKLSPADTLHHSLFLPPKGNFISSFSLLKNRKVGGGEDGGGGRKRINIKRQLTGTASATLGK